ncbi:uncharacterized protein PITG_08897 [Phytophthora infestans T30-4]|uniref:Uncharacterized protein n=1 Tax=Phytophthora infestans (strain T30-4) TaxID=403677 RepID=D0NDG2_PHYIT|nr:uncharacterized protein PITG_08897 [Phytophthora infestans T30-4]EEY56119.1 hypothetical protein PITG_08897 [Phytophthora infestans T30-4]|eukprot:XP_002902949.1 hypothetical protein PITG_08897 [Phytophthora infestans T30-4]
MVAAGVGAVLLYMMSNRKDEHAPASGRDPRAPPSKMN